jgi:hypothetical protein
MTVHGEDVCFGTIFETHSFSAVITG